MAKSAQPKKATTRRRKPADPASTTRRRSARTHKTGDAPAREPMVAADDRDAAAPGSDSRMTGAAVAVGRTLGRAVAAVAARVPWGTGQEDAVGLLEHDHRRLESLLKQCEDLPEGEGGARVALFETIAAELKVHELIEEKVFYPALKTHASAREIVLEGYQEHHVADLLVQELHDLPVTDERWAPKFGVLKENLEHHIEEEEDDMFPKAKKIMSSEQLVELGNRMRAMKESAGDSSS
jgi:hypothetical protein